MKRIKLSLIPFLFLALLVVVLAATKTTNKAEAQTPPPATSFALIVLRSGLYISLPPMGLYTPDSLIITNKNTGGTVASFTGITAALKKYACNTSLASPLVECVNGTNNGYTLHVYKNYTSTGGVLDEYSIKVVGFTDGDDNRIAANINPTIASLVGISEAASAAAKYNFDLTFSTPSLSSAQKILDYINTNSTSLSNVSTEMDSTHSCSIHPGAGASGLAAEDKAYPYLCMGINVRFMPLISTGLFGIKLPPIEEAVFANSGGGNGGNGNIVIKGNTAAGGTQSGFDINSGAIAIGGKVELNGTSSGLPVPGYISTSPLNWSSVSPELTKDYNLGVSSGVIPSPADNSSSWYLDSNNSNPTNSSSTTFSSPPEGKQWYVPGNLTINNPMSFNGLGTIVVNGNVTFNGDVSCSQGSDVGIIASGNITFNGTSGVSCGAYVSLNGSITFPQSQSISQDQTWAGIFIAEQNIVLPTTKYNVYINYDANLAENPPILFRSILNTIASASS